MHSGHENTHKNCLICLTNKHKSWVGIFHLALFWFVPFVPLYTFSDKILVDYELNKSLFCCCAYALKLGACVELESIAMHSKHQRKKHNHFSHSAKIRRFFCFKLFAYTQIESDFLFIFVPHRAIVISFLGQSHVLIILMILIYIWNRDKWKMVSGCWNVRLNCWPIWRWCGGAMRWPLFHPHRRIPYISTSTVLLSLFCGMENCMHGSVI